MIQGMKGPTGFFCAFQCRISLYIRNQYSFFCMLLVMGDINYKECTVREGKRGDNSQNTNILYWKTIEDLCNNQNDIEKEMIFYETTT